MKLGFRSRMMLGILAVAFLFTAGLFLYNYHSSRRLIEQNYISAQTEKMSLQAAAFDNVMQQAYELSVHMGTDASLRRQTADYLAGSRSYEAASAVAQSLRDFLPKNSLLDAVYLYLPDAGQIISSEEYYTVCPVEDAEQLLWESWERPLTPLFFRNAIGRVSQRVYAYIAPLHNRNGEPLGTLCITIDERQLYYALLAPLANAGEEEYQIIDPEGRVCSAESAAQIGSLPSGLDALPANRIDVGSAAGDLLSISVQAPFSGYRVLCLSRRTQLTQTIRDRQTVQALIMATVFLFLLIVAWMVSKWLYRPVEKLTAAIDQVSRGDFTARVVPSHTDEFATLTEHFNDMVGRIDGLMHQVVREQTEKKQAELHALQYQIRPHFMYNTLNSIRFAATLQRNKTLADQLGAFIQLLEASIQKKGAFLPLCEELELVESFVALQKFRYSDCFTIEYTVSEEAKRCYVPCLLLQPVVENAIFHGIDTRRTDNCMVLTAAVRGDRLYLSLRDNGQGMDAETVQGLLVGDPAEDKRRLTGIGLRNIQERLRLYYGEKAWFRITSAPGEGTCAEFDLPVSHDPEEYRI